MLCNLLCTNLHVLSCWFFAGFHVTKGSYVLSNILRHAVTHLDSSIIWPDLKQTVSPLLNNFSSS